MGVETKRIEEVDIGKGIAMFLAVIGHSLPDAVKGFWIAGDTSAASFIYHWIYSFHMATFFFFAGFLFIPKVHGVISSILAKRLKRLMIPYFFYSSIYLLLKSFFGTLADNALEDHAFLMMFLGYSPSYGCWFLWVLFMISMFFLLLRSVNIYLVTIIVTFGYGLVLVVGGNSVPFKYIVLAIQHSLWFALGGG